MKNFIRKMKTPDYVSGFDFKKKLAIFCVLVSLTQVQVFAGETSGTNALEKIEQQDGISGQVKDQKGVPLPGATVSIKGTKISTITDFDGKFNLKGDQNAILVVSFIGFVTQEVQVNNKTNITVQLVEDAASLNEVVVVGYGKMKKSDLTGAIVQVKPESLANQNPNTVQDLLRGVPGLKVGYSADAKGGGSLQIRGQTSVYSDGGHNSPLIILDGMQFYGELSEINPDDVGQIDVLKDASATAVYGSKAAAGVIVISTKKGKTGKPIINLTTNMTIVNESAYRNVYSPEGYVKYREDWETAKSYGTNTATGNYEAYVTGTAAGKAGYFSNPNQLAQYGITQAQWLAYQPAAQIQGKSINEVWGNRLGITDATLLKNFAAGTTHDWYGSTFRTGINRDNNLSVSGASDKVNYYMSLGYLTSEGAIQGNDYSAVRANMKVDAKITNWLEFGANVNFQDRSDGDISVGTGTNYWDANMLRNSPFANFKEANGDYARQPMGPTIGGYNYYYDRQYMDLEKGYTVLNTIFNTKVTLPLDITYTFNASPRYEFFYNRYFQSAGNKNWNAATIGVDRGNGKKFTWNINNTIAWDHTFAGKHHIIATFVQEAEDLKTWSDIVYARNIQPSDALGFHNTANATLLNSSFSTTDTHQTADGLMGRLFYSYDNRYMITATIRRDGYSAFGATYPYATFPSVAGGWSFNKESWFNWDAMSTGKLRLSWGKNGNRSLADPYLALANLGSGTGATMGYIDASGKIVDMKYLAIDRMANPNLQWEKTEATNIGLDLGFLNDKITSTIDIYRSVTHDMIMSQRLPGFSGFSSIATNLGEVENKGIEISLNTINIKKPNFEWTTMVAFSYNKNTINKLYGNMEDVKDANGNVIGTKEADDKTNGWFIGKSISQIWDYKVTGIWQKDEAVEAAKYGQRPGDPKVENSYTADDVNGKPTYNDKDKQFLGQTAPPINWSLRNEFKIYKNWDLAINMYSYMGHKSLDGRYMNTYNDGSLYTNNYNPFVNPYWTIDNPTNDWARLDARGPAGAGTAKLYDRSFIRLDNISLAYSLPKDLIDRLHVRNFKIYASVQNAATWSASGEWKYYGDPETGGLATRMFNLGFNVSL
ncbi:SusC/RagA family TonB-linked outer membrane protein [Flavobacterium sp. 245]|uniref:SusC/RagA family TonB-linked outer membrane protein n=1 Tax=Flavobacterium sp. 245 TaxID=2512115 RepID=UPI00105D1213|nr:SusC/RagA family TonB-linked outer membrane protein [Flavobacterium sp. 245]TDO99112.1 TonB-linked SusC/RagA family outer membrane protein [Flavobacterium sp. 245]